MAENDKFVAPVDVKEQLQKTAKIYRNKLITMPTRGLKKSLSYMTLRPGPCIRDRRRTYRRC